MDENTPVTTKTLSTSNSYAVSGKIMLITVIVSFSVSILILIFHFYYRYSNLNRHPTPDDQRFPIRNRALTSKGLSQSVLQSLPVFLYSAAQEPLECAICLSEFQQNQSGRILPKCSHVFHLQCIDTWFVSHPDCPLCRAKVQAPNVTGCDSQSEDASGSYLNASGSSSVVRISSPVPEVAVDIPTETSETGSGTSENGGPYAS